MGLIFTAPRNLTPKEWRLVLSVVKHQPQRQALAKLRAGKNAPQRACDLFDELSLVNQYGHEYTNNWLRKAKVPFRLTRIGSWQGRQPRNHRLLAVVPWPSPNTS